jgi:hypothetical protein
VDPITRLSYHELIGEQVGAFRPNGRAHPAQQFAGWFEQAAKDNPDLAPLVADAICLGVAIQLAPPSSRTARSA